MSFVSRSERSAVSEWISFHCHFFLVTVHCPACEGHRSSRSFPVPCLPGSFFQNIFMSSRNDHLYMPEDHMEHLYASRNPLVRYAHCNRLEMICEEVPRAPLLVLDAGCGEGHLLAALQARSASYSLFGVDVTDVALAQAAKRCPQAAFSSGDLCALPYPDASFDVVTCTEVIEHIFSYQEVLKEFRRVLRPGGILILTFPNEPVWTLSRILLGRIPFRVPDHVNSFTPNRLLRETGLRLRSSRGLPFRIPFAISLGYLMVFEK